MTSGLPDESREEDERRKERRGSEMPARIPHGGERKRSNAVPNDSRATFGNSWQLRTAQKASFAFSNRGRKQSIPAW